MAAEFVQGARQGRIARLLALVAALAGAAVVVAAVMIRAAPDDPARWHVDPLSAERTGKPNDFLVLPEGMNAEADAMMPLVAVAALELMERFETVALGSARVERLAGGPQLLFATYVQRSALFGFPDYISVRAVQAEDGAALAIWSRSRYGHSDLGVNRRRIERWVESLGVDLEPGA